MISYSHTFLYFASSFPTAVESEEGYICLGAWFSFSFTFFFVVWGGGG